MMPVCMRRNYRLTFIPECLSYKRFCNAVCKFRRDIILRIKRLDIVNSLQLILLLPEQYSYMS